MTLQETTERGERLASLRELAQKLAREIDECTQPSLLPQLARQYRETLKEIEEIDPPEEDDVSEIIDGFAKVR